MIPLKQNKKKIAQTIYPAIYQLGNLHQVQETSNRGWKNAITYEVRNPTYMTPLAANTTKTGLLYDPCYLIAGCAELERMFKVKPQVNCSLELPNIP